jgi:hypothetical protein
MTPIVCCLRCGTFTPAADLVIDQATGAVRCCVCLWLEAAQAPVSAAVETVETVWGKMAVGGQG